MCGYYARTFFTACGKAGSPPRVRVLQQAAAPAEGIHRITPACAGTTKRADPEYTANQDHPRVCGYYPNGSPSRTISPGSPPRVRVLPTIGHRSKADTGITPACAGTTSIRRIFGGLSRDHPRVCGYYYGGITNMATIGGSPPRVRVLRRVSFRPRQGRRITPACAGTTPASERQYAGIQDHPRVCGYYVFAVSFAASVKGSPPRVRVLQRGAGNGFPLIGITPACAGTTLFSYLPIRQARDHPRVCGYYFFKPPVCRRVIGSPPRVRVLPQLGKSSNTTGGITPACAGTTAGAVPDRRERRDHPRVCGYYAETV